MPVEHRRYRDRSMAACGPGIRSTPAGSNSRAPGTDVAHSLRAAHDPGSAGARPSGSNIAARCAVIGSAGSPAVSQVRLLPPIGRSWIRIRPSTPIPQWRKTRPCHLEGLPWSLRCLRAAGRILPERVAAHDRTSRCAPALEATGLLRRVFHATVRAEHAAIPRLGLQ